MTAPAVVLAPLGALLAGMALEALLAGVLSARGKGRLAFASGLASLAGVLAAWPEIARGRAVDVTFGAWDGPAQLAYHVDGLAFFFAFMGTAVGSAVLLYSVRYLEKEKGATRFYLLVLLFVAGLVHLVYTADLLLLYLSWELVGLCSFLLVSFWYRQPEAAYGARKVLTMTHLAGYGLLAAVLLVYVRTGSTRWTDPAVQGALSSGVFLLLLVAALAKSVQFPLHTWIPDAMAAPTPVSALLHAACYVKAGVYLVARMRGLAAWPAWWGELVCWLGAVTLLVGVLFALAQHDLKRLLAFHTVSQIGYMMLGLGLGTPLGIAAGLLHCLNHALFKGGLFLCAGAVQHACGTRDMDRLGGLARRMPRVARLWLVLAGGIAGVPLLNGFVSKWLLYNAALEAHQPVLALIPWLGSVLTVFSFLKATSSVFLGEDGPATAEAHEAPWSMVAGIGVLAAGCALLGVAPQLAVAGLVNPALVSVGSAPISGIGWLGLMAGQGEWMATAGLLLGLLALAVGAPLYLLATRRTGLVVAAAGGAAFSGGEPLGAMGRVGASDFSQAAKDFLSPFYRGFDVDRLWLGLWHLAGKVCSWLARALERAERYPVAILAATGGLVAAAALLVPAASGVAHPSAAIPPVHPLAAAVVLSLAGGLLGSLAIPARRSLAAPLAAAGALAVAGLLLGSPLARVRASEAAAAVALIVLWRSTGVAGARRGYLAAVALSAAGIVGGTLAAEHGHPVLALALLIPGVAIKLGLVPCFVWLPMVAESAPAVVTGLVVAVVDVAAFGELLWLRAAQPSLFAPEALWLVLGLGSALLGAALCLAQRDLKRLLAFSTLSDMGLLLTALTLGGRHGLTGAAVGAGVHALAKSLLFTSLAAPEAEGTPTLDARGLATRHPMAAIGFLVGALSVLGVPPTLGFAAHWRIFAAAAAQPWLLALLAASSMLGVAVFARAIALGWFGEGRAEPATGVAWRPVYAIAVLLPALALVAGGVWPALWGGIP